MQGKSLLKNIARGARAGISRMLHNPYKDLNIGIIRMKYLKHLPPGKLYRHQMHGGTLYFTKPQELLHGLQEIFIDEIYKVQLPANAYILDCGSNIGLSIIYFKEKFPDATIFAFEPDDENYKLLAKNVESFQCSNVELKKEAVWISDTTLQFKSEGSMGSKIDESGDDEKTKAVKASRLKNYLNRKIDFLKIDIEGAEYAVLKDIKDDLKNVEKLFLEYHGRFDQNPELLEILQIVLQQGFQFYIREAAPVHKHPFARSKTATTWDVQLNIFCFRT